MADAQASGACYGNIVWVQVPSSAVRLKKAVAYAAAFFYPFASLISQAITCMLIQNIAAIPRSQLITFTIRSVLHHILFILGLACEQNIAAVN